MRLPTNPAHLTMVFSAACAMSGGVGAFAMGTEGTAALTDGCPTIPIPIATPVPQSEPVPAPVVAAAPTPNALTASVTLLVPRIRVSSRGVMRLVVRSTGPGIFKVQLFVAASHRGKRYAYGTRRRAIKHARDIVLNVSPRGPLTRRFRVASSKHWYFARMSFSTNGKRVVTTTTFRVKRSATKN